MIGIVIIVVVISAFAVGNVFLKSMEPPITSISFDPKTLTQGSAGSIVSVTVKQYDGANWLTRGVASNDDFTISVQPDQPTNITLLVYLDYGYAASVEQAKSYTRAYITIETVVSGTAMTQKSGTTYLEGYRITFSYLWNDGPAEGVNYAIVLDYQAYY